MIGTTSFTFPLVFTVHCVIMVLFMVTLPSMYLLFPLCCKSVLGFGEREEIMYEIIFFLIVFIDSNFQVH